MIKVIAFDVGGVCVNGSMGDFYKDCCSFLNVKETRDFYSLPHIEEDYNRGKISAREAFENIFERRLTDSEYEEVKKRWLATFTKNVDTYKLIEKLTKTTYRLAILSNSDQLVSDKLKSEGLYDPFECVILSHEVQMIKPDPRIYDLLIEKVGVLPDEILFIDDNIRCIEGARQKKIETIRFRDAGHLRGKLEKTGIIEPAQ